MRPDEADTGGTYMGEHTWLMAALMYGIMWQNIAKCNKISDWLTLTSGIMGVKYEAN